MAVIGIHRMKVGNLLPILSAQLRDQTGAALDLSSGGTTVKLVMKNRATGAVKINNQPCAIVAPASGGNVTYTWAGTDTDTAGEYDAEFQVLLGGLTPMTVPNDGGFPIVILPRLA